MLYALHDAAAAANSVPHGDTVGRHGGHHTEVCLACGFCCLEAHELHDGVAQQARQVGYRKYDDG